MLKPKALKKGDIIGVVAPSNPIIGDNIIELNSAKKIIEDMGYIVKFSDNTFNNDLEYSANHEKKADDINKMFGDNNIKAIWCAKGGENSNGIFEFLNYELIKNNPKIICGYSDITSVTNIISEKCGFVTFSSTNFKAIATDETRYSLDNALDMFERNKFANEGEYWTINKGKCEGELVGGNLTLITNLATGKYKVNFRDKILFIEELGFETSPASASRKLHFLKQNGVFDEICGLWIGNYENEFNISLEKIVLNTLGENIGFPIIKSNNFGHIEKKITIPIGVKAKIDTEEDIKIKLLQNAVDCL